jgi:hypothetical protein
MKDCQPKVKDRPALAIDKAPLEPIDFDWLEWVIKSLPETDPDTVAKMREDARY